MLSKLIENLYGISTFTAGECEELREKLDCLLKELMRLEQSNRSCNCTRFFLAYQAVRTDCIGASAPYSCTTDSAPAVTNFVTCPLEIMGSIIE
jgi:hypothetical protein